MRIIDAHAHCFDALTGFGAEGELRMRGNGIAAWADGKEQRIIPEGMGDMSFPIETLLGLMDEHGVEKAVLMQGGFLGFQNEYVHKCQERYPERIRAAATFDPYCRNAKDILSHQLDDVGFRIFKFEVSTGCGIMGSHPAFPLDSGMMMDIYSKISEKGGVIAFDLGSPGDESHQAKAIKNIASTFRSMPMTICHLGSFKLGHERIFSEEIRIMDAENIFFDLAALFWKTRPEQYPFPVSQSYVKEAKDVIGTDRLMWGSDVPSTAVKLSYQKQIDYIKDCFTGDEIDKVFYRNADSLYFSR